MPSGETHEKASVIMTFVASTILLGLGTPLPDVAALSVGILSTYWLSADLDIKSSHPFKRWWVFKKIWEVYQKPVKHGCWLSHSVLLSTVVRITYLLLLWVLSWSIATIIVFVLTGKPPFFNWLDELIKWRLFWIWLVGLIIGDIVHVLMDFTWRMFKR